MAIRIGRVGFQRLKIMYNINIKRIDDSVPIPVGNPFKVVCWELVGCLSNNLMQIRTGLFFNDIDEEKYEFEAESNSSGYFWVIKTKLIENELVLLVGSAVGCTNHKKGDIVASVSIVKKKELETVRFIEKNKSGGRIIAGDAVVVKKEEE